MEEIKEKWNRKGRFFNVGLQSTAYSYKMPSYIQFKVTTPRQLYHSKTLSGSPFKTSNKRK